VRAANGSLEIKWASEEYRQLFYDKANWDPVTLYICIDQSIAGAFSAITSLLYEVLANSLISIGPYGYNERTRRVVGPLEIVFALDEFAKLPKTPKLLEGPDLARSKGVSFIICCKSAGQLEQIYSKPEVQTIIGTTAVKYILTQNDADTIKMIQSWVSQTTIMLSSKTTQEGLQKGANPLAHSAAESLQGVNFLRSEDISAMPPGNHILIVQGHLNKPMRLKTPLFFQDKTMLSRVRSRGKGPIATEIVPAFVAAKRLEEIRLQMAADRKRNKHTELHDAKTLEPNPQHETERVTLS